MPTLADHANWYLRCSISQLPDASRPLCVTCRCARRQVCVLGGICTGAVLCVQALWVRIANLVDEHVQTLPCSKYSLCHNTLEAAADAKQWYRRQEVACLTPLEGLHTVTGCPTLSRHIPGLCARSCANLCCRDFKACCSRQTARANASSAQQDCALHACSIKYCLRCNWGALTLTACCAAPASPAKPVTWQH